MLLLVEPTLARIHASSKDLDSAEEVDENENKNVLNHRLLDEDFGSGESFLTAIDLEYCLLRLMMIGIAKNKEITGIVG